jgi:hypothetical protein
VSPWVEPGTVSHLAFDHTSILKTIITRFLHDNPPRLGERVDRAKASRTCYLHRSRASATGPQRARETRAKGGGHLSRSP